MEYLRLTPPPEKPVVYWCKGCGGEIYDGNEYYDVDGETYCRHCVKKCVADAEEEWS